MKRKTLYTLFLITLLSGFNLGSSSAAPAAQADAPDHQIVETDDDDAGDGTGDVQDEDATNAATAAVSSAAAGTILTGPSVSGEAVRILSTGYTLQALSGCSPIDPRCNADPIIVGSADLFTPWIIDRLKAAYDSGHAVGVTNATVASLQRLHDLLQHHGSVQPVPGSAALDLVAFRKVQRSDGQFHFSSHLLLPRVTPDIPDLNKKAKRRFQGLPKKVKRSSEYSPGSDRHNRVWPIATTSAH